MTLADLRRKPVVSMSDGTKIGEVDDLIVDLSDWRIVALFIDGKGNRGPLSLDRIKGIGPDAVTVERAEMVEWSAKPNGRFLADLKELTVVDGSGTVLGHLHDLKYEATGAIESIELHHGGVLGLGVHVTVVTPSRIRGVGERLITVELLPA